MRTEREVRSFVRDLRAMIAKPCSCGSNPAGCRHVPRVTFEQYAASLAECLEWACGDANPLADAAVELAAQEARR